MMTPSGIEGFAGREVTTDRGMVFCYEGGTGPPILLLHGFPETSLMWHGIAPLLASDFAVVAADLPGYGRSDCPIDGAGHGAMSKRALASALVAAMKALGHDSFAIIGHDRGGRVAYRAALDHPDMVTAVAVLDVIPTYEVWERADARLALSFWPFSLLAQPAPLPERLLLAAPAAVVDNALSEWGSPPETFPSWLREAYVAALSDPNHVHAICEEYRAAAGIDRDIDRAHLETGRRIRCPLLVLWSGKGGLATWYNDAGGPLGIWRRWAEDVHGHAVAGGHFFPEEQPEATADAIMTFLHNRAKGH
jgi:haloacetate dehalogenase